MTSPLPTTIEQSDADGRDSIAQWRSQFLNTILRFSFLIGLVVGAPSIAAAVREGQWTIVVADVCALAVVGLLWRNPQWSYRVRALGVIAILYSLGTVFIVAVGPVSLVYLMATPVMAALLIGLRPAMVALTINAITLFTVGYLADAGIGLPGFADAALLKWMVITANTSFVSGLIAVAGAVPVQRLELALARQQHNNARLQKETAVRQRAEEEVRQLNAGLEERVRERTAQLTEANGELQEFAYAVSHDLRAPLSTIDGFGAAIDRRAGQDDPQVRRHVERIRAAAQQMGHLIDAMLSLAHLSSSGLDWERVDLSEIASRVLADYHERHPEHSVHSEVQPGVVALGDSRLLRQVLDNLLGNAWKFTAAQPGARIAFSCRTNEQGDAVYEVTDNGPGFDMAYVGRLFRPFERLHTTKEFPGTGIGLATVHRIVVRHGGRVWAQAAPGAGATFSFTLGAQRPDRGASDWAPL